MVYTSCNSQAYAESNDTSREGLRRRVTELQPLKVTHPEVGVATPTGGGATPTYRIGGRDL